MSLHLTVAAGLAPLADVLADELAVPLADPFAREVVAVPGDGVRTWLAARVSHRLGIVANVEFVFPGRLVRRALGEHPAREWSIGPLTWAVHEVMCAEGEQLGLSPDAVRARSIADLFDRYSIHRAEMVRRWELGFDVDGTGEELPAHQRWQPVLWRRVVAILGPSDATAMARAVEDLRAGTREPELPERVFLLGLTSLPAPQLDVLTAIADRREVHVLTPAPSLDLWRRLRSRVDEAPAARARPCPRTSDPTADLPHHRLLATWGRPAREAHVALLAAATDGTRVRLVEAAPAAGAHPGAPTLLRHLQHQILTDTDPPGPSAAGALDFRFPLDRSDRSVQWHRCHGLGRQVEAVRDVIAHLLQEPLHGVPLEPRDIAILTPDIAAVAPLAEAVFAGDPERGVPALPLRVADRSLRQDNPLLDAVGALLDLLDGRFRASDVLAFASRPPVRRRFGLHPEHLEQLVEWAELLNVRWGLDPATRERFGIPASISAHTWQAGVDRLLLGAVMADRGERLGLGRTVPFGDLEGDHVELAGTLAELLHRMTRAQARLSRDQPVASWCEGVRDAAIDLFAVTDADSWQWRDLERELSEMAADATLPRIDARDVPAGELAALLGARLVGRPGRARFGSGAITLSSLTAQRGVPHRVVCLVGIDGDLGGAAAIGGDDLIAAAACVGDRDPRSEARAQLLDAVLAATDRLLVFSSGRDVRSNAEVPPAVPLAELADLVDASALAAWSTDAHPVRASAAIAVDHPRQAWSEANFEAERLGVDGPLSFDRGARDAALRRRGQHQRTSLVTAPLPPEPRTDVELADLATTLDNPVRTLLQSRLGLWLESAKEVRDDLVPLQVATLELWRLRRRLVQARLAALGEWTEAQASEWAEVQGAAGNVPPLAFGAAAVAGADADVAALFRAGRAAVGAAVDQPPHTVPIDVPLPGGRRLRGEVPGVRGNVALEITPTTLKAKHRLQAWLKLVALSCAQPEVPWQVVLVGRDKSKDPACVHLSMRPSADARRLLELVDDLHWRARAAVVPAMPATCHALHTKNRLAAAKEWRGGRFGGDGTDDWVRFAIGEVELDDVLQQPPAADEVGEEWGVAASQLERWAHRIWSAFDGSTIAGGSVIDDDADEDEADLTPPNGMATAAGGGAS